ncbi:MAG: cold-shock protein [Cyclobacteriaceae bacterium]
MGGSQNKFIKNQKEKRKQKKKQEKQERKKERQENSPGGGLENMIAYVDEFGNITDTPPEEKPVKKENDKEKGQ